MPGNLSCLRNKIFIKWNEWSRISIQVKTHRCNSKLQLRKVYKKTDDGYWSFVGGIVPGQTSWVSLDNKEEQNHGHAFKVTETNNWMLKPSQQRKGLIVFTHKKSLSPYKSKVITFFPSQKFFLLYKVFT